MLNLGILTNTVLKNDFDTDYESMYVDFIESSSRLINLINAYEISRKALLSNSVECLNFAESLLGASCEIIAEKTVAEMMRTAVNSATKYKKLLLSIKQAVAVFSEDRYASQLQKMRIPVSKRLSKFDEEWTPDISNKKEILPGNYAIARIKNAVDIILDTIDDHSSVSKLLTIRKCITSRYGEEEQDKQIKYIKSWTLGLRYVIVECNRIIKLIRRTVDFVPKKSLLSKSDDESKYKEQTKQRQGPYPDYVKVGVRSDGSTAEFREKRNPW